MNDERVTIALAGNANVGKSVIFNHLTGLHQHIGNWPGKTIEKAEGTLHFKGRTIDIIDLPGIYSLSTFSLEELITREYIAKEQPDLVINVVDASVLERNLFFTLQLIELETPMIIALNQMDIAKRKGVEIDHKKLAAVLGVSVIPTVAPNRTGIYELLETAVTAIEEKPAPLTTIRYGEEIEEKIQELAKEVQKFSLPYPTRWIVTKLFEGDDQVLSEIQKSDPLILSKIRKAVLDIEGIHGHACSTVITSARYEAAGCVARDVQQIVPLKKTPKRERLHTLTTHNVLGYLIMMGVLLFVFVGIFTFGDGVSSVLSGVFALLGQGFWTTFGTGPLATLVWGGVFEGLIAGVTIVLPYIFPFYLMLYFLEDSGYLSRIAFLMDNFMHRIGLHGKAFIPLMLGFGCNVPGCLGCRIMETQRERLLAIFLVTLVPCAATTIIILGLVGASVGLQWALLLYLVDFALITILGKIASKALPGESTGLIMEMHDYKVPHAKTVMRQTWFRLQDFIKMAFPLIIAGSFAIKLAEVLNLLDPIAYVLSPITVSWLGLPAITGITLIFGVLRKELTLIMLSTLLETQTFVGVPNFGSIQMIVLALVAMLYIPCISTIGALVREIGWKKALYITAFEIGFAIVVGGIAYRLLLLAGF